MQETTSWMEELVHSSAKEAVAAAEISIARGSSVYSTTHPNHRRGHQQVLSMAFQGGGDY